MIFASYPLYAYRYTLCISIYI